MENSEEITLRVSKLIKELGINKQTLAKAIGVHKNDIYKYFNGQLNFGPTLVTRIIKAYPQINPSWLLLGLGEITLPKEQGNTITINRGGDVSGNNNNYAVSGQIESHTEAFEEPTYENTAVPYFDVESAECGLQSGFGVGLTMNNSSGSVVLPTLKTKQGDIFISTRGRSMIDTNCPERSIPEGAMVLVRKWTANYIEWGEIYCVVTSDGYVVKRLMPGASEATVKCVSADSENYPPYEISKQDIQGIGRVIAVVSTTLL